MRSRGHMGGTTLAAWPTAGSPHNAVGCEHGLALAPTDEGSCGRRIASVWRPPTRPHQCGHNCDKVCTELAAVAASRVVRAPTPVLAAAKHVPTHTTKHNTP